MNPLTVDADEHLADLLSRVGHEQHQQHPPERRRRRREVQEVADGEEQHAADRGPPGESVGRPERQVPRALDAHHRARGDDAEREQCQLDEPEHEARRAGHHLPGGELDGARREHPAGEERRERGDQQPDRIADLDVGRDQEHRERARECREDREHQLQRLGSHELREADERAEHEGHERSLPRRRQQERQARHQERVPEGAHEPPVPRSHGADLVQAPDALERFDRRLLRLLQQRVQRGDLVEPERRGERRTQRDPALLRRPGLHDDGRREHQDVGVVLPVGARHGQHRVADPVDRLGGGVHPLRESEEESAEDRAVADVGHLTPEAHAIPTVEGVSSAAEACPSAAGSPAVVGRRRAAPRGVPPRAAALLPGAARAVATRSGGARERLLRRRR